MACSNSVCSLSLLIKKFAVILYPQVLNKTFPVEHGALFLQFCAFICDNNGDIDRASIHHTYIYGHEY